MRRFFSKRKRILVIIGAVLFLVFLDTGWIKFSISRVPAKSTSEFQTVLRTAPPWLQSALSEKKHNATTADVQNFTAAIILTYMRSGSSLTGEIIQQHPDVFYVFEPLHMLETSFRAKFPIQYLNGTYLKQGTYQWTDIALPTLRAWLTCDLENVYQRGLLDKLFMGFGKKTAIFHQCLEEMNPLNLSKLYRLTFAYCVSKLREVCLASKHRVIKTLRTRMHQIHTIMSVIPNIKVIHLVRDPRDTMMSQNRVGACGNSTLDEITNCTSFHCTRLNHDIITKEEWPRIRNITLSIYYEDLALHPLKVSGKMYKFLDLELNQKIKNSIHNLTSDGLMDGCVVCQEPWQQMDHSKSDRMASIKKWKTRMPTGFRVIVDMLCKESISYLNYSVNPIPFGV